MSDKNELILEHLIEMKKDIAELNRKIDVVYDKVADLKKTDATIKKVLRTRFGY